LQPRPLLSPLVPEFPVPPLELVPPSPVPPPGARAPPLQLPPGHVAPSGFAGSSQRPVSGSLVPAAWQASGAMQTTLSPPVHAPGSDKVV
jgi:hypothetical protein